MKRDNQAATARRGAEAVGPANVLVVDDDPAVLRMIGTLLEHHGCRVITASNGLEAIAMHIGHGDVDLIVSDIDMPEMDGLTMCEYLDGHRDGATVILISGLEVDPDRICEKSESVVGFLSKPFAIEDLLTTAGRAIAH